MVEMITSFILAGMLALSAAVMLVQSVIGIALIYRTASVEQK